MAFLERLYSPASTSSSKGSPTKFEHVALSPFVCAVLPDLKPPHVALDCDSYLATWEGLEALLVALCVKGLHDVKGFPDYILEELTEVGTNRFLELTPPKHVWHLLEFAVTCLAFSGGVDG